MSAQDMTKAEIEEQTPILSARGLYKSYGQRDRASTAPTSTSIPARSSP